MSPSALWDFLRRELSPTPGRSGATFRLTLACLAATIPVLTHRIPHALIVMIVMYIITQEDTAATVLGSILGIAGVTIGLSAALIAWKISLDIPWLRLCFFIAFFFGGLFLKRVLTIGGLGSAIGLPGSLAIILPDILPTRPPEVIVEFVLWCWWCAVLGLSVNACVQLLMAPGDPLMLLRRELDTRLVAVETAIRRLAGERITEPAPAPLRPLAIAGMTRPLGLLKTASIFHQSARQRQETLLALITLTDRLVTSAIALEALAPEVAGEIHRDRLLRVAGGCARMRRAFEDLRLPATGEWVTLAGEQNPATVFPLADMERTLDQIALVLPIYLEEDSEGASPYEKRRLFLPDAFENPEYVRFAVKGTLAALICYISFIGFDYRGIYTSVITCFVVSVSTIGASRQKGLFRFGGAAVGGGMGLIAIMYLLPNVETIGGFWLVFGAGTAVAAWANFGSPRISYGGYQAGLAFYKAVLQGFGPALSAKVIRDRLVGVFFGLAVFGIVEHFLWPVKARDALRALLAQVMRSLAELARTGTSSATPTKTGNAVDSWRRKIALNAENIQKLIESSKFEMGVIEASRFERGDFKVDAAQKFTADVQIVYVLLLSLARQKQDATYPDGVRTAEIELDSALATALSALETHAATGSPPAMLHLQGLSTALERYAAVSAKVPGELAADAHLSDSMTLYRAVVTAIKVLFSDSLNAGEEGHEVADFAQRGEVRA
jgi:multidrug resistance protein MdtO